MDIRPAYPAEAQAQHLTGSGLFVLHLNPKNGRVQLVQIEKSTGHKILDEAAAAAFTNLQFKNHAVSRVRIPVTFEIPPNNSGPRVTRNFPATWLAESQPLRINSGKGMGRK